VLSTQELWTTTSPNATSTVTTSPFNVATPAAGAFHQLERWSQKFNVMGLLRRPACSSGKILSTPSTSLPSATKICHPFPAALTAASTASSANVINAFATQRSSGATKELLTWSTRTTKLVTSIWSAKAPASPVIHAQKAWSSIAVVESAQRPANALRSPPSATLPVQCRPKANGSDLSSH